MNSYSKLAADATVHKKAWLCAAYMLGKGRNMTVVDLWIPPYATWSGKSLKPHIRDLRSDLRKCLDYLLVDGKHAKLSTIVPWLAERFDAWQSAGGGIFEVGRLHEIERAIGRLRCHEIKDCPPYAQLLLQGSYEPAIRHPEYHLASDLALLWNLFLDSERMMDEALERNEWHSSERSQTLGRSLILTCYNLLESFVSGLAMAWLIENPDAAESTRSILTNGRRPLRSRFVEFPALITGQPGIIDGNASPVQELFDYKRRRDAFVHCEPGPEPDPKGHVKELYFHDVTRAVVESILVLTDQAICLVWQVVHNKDRPSWLPRRNSSGRYDRVRLRLEGEKTLPTTGGAVRSAPANQPG